MPRQKKVTDEYSKQKNKRNVKVIDLKANEEFGNKRTKLEQCIVVRNSPVKADHSQEAENENENLVYLRKFDLDPLLGPCRGITRTERLERAYRFHLNSGIELDNVQEILGLHCDEPGFDTCIWDQKNY